VKCARLNASGKVEIYYLSKAEHAMAIDTSVKCADCNASGTRIFYYMPYKAETFYYMSSKAEIAMLKDMMTNAQLALSLYDVMATVAKECQYEKNVSKNNLQTIDNFLAHGRLPSSRALVEWVYDEFMMNSSDAFSSRFRSLLGERLAGKSDTCWRDPLREPTSINIRDHAVVIQGSLKLGSVFMKSNMKNTYETCPEALSYTGHRRIEPNGTRHTSQDEREWYVMRVYEHLGYIPAYLLSLVSSDMFMRFEKGELDHISFEEWFNEIYFTRAQWLRSRKTDIDITRLVPVDAVKALCIFRRRSLEMKQAEAEIGIVSLLPGELTAIITLYLKALFFKV